MDNKELNEYIAKEIYGWEWREEFIYSHNNKIGTRIFWTGPKKYENNLPDFINMPKEYSKIIENLRKKGIKIE